MDKLKTKYIEILKEIKQTSPFSEKETERISKKFFDGIPNSVKILINRYAFDQKKVLDIGCSFGWSFLYWGKDSEGIELYGPAIEFLEKMKRKIYPLNVENNFDEIRGKKYEAIYCNNLIEHLIAPHLFLLRLNNLLETHGILAIGVPVVPSKFSFIWENLGFRGWLAKQHIGFFTFETMKLTLERAGFEILEWWSPGVYRFSKFLSRVLVRRMPHILFICKKNENFKYDEIRPLDFNPCWAEGIENFYQKNN